MYDWADDFTKSWELWRRTKRAELLSKLAPQGAPEARDGQSMSTTDEDVSSPPAPAVSLQGRTAGASLGSA